MPGIYGVTSVTGFFTICIGSPIFIKYHGIMSFKTVSKKTSHVTCSVSEVLKITFFSMQHTGITPPSVALWYCTSGLLSVKHFAISVDKHDCLTARH